MFLEFQPPNCRETLTTRYLWYIKYWWLGNTQHSGFSPHVHVCWLSKGEVLHKNEPLWPFWLITWLSDSSTVTSTLIRASYWGINKLKLHLKTVSDTIAFDVLHIYHKSQFSPVSDHIISTFQADAGFHIDAYLILPEPALEWLIDFSPVALDSSWKQVVNISGTNQEKKNKRVR